MTSSGTNRREFIKHMSYAGGALAFGDMGALFSFKDSLTPDKVRDALKQRIRGKIVIDSLLIEEFTTDFGKTIRREPRVIVKPHDNSDIVTIFQVAREFEVPVAIRGAGHTCYGQSLSDGGILIINKKSELDSTIQDDRISVSSGSQWNALEKMINPQGLTSPVLTDYLGLTVGGTLSVGGYGLRSFHYGAQVDNVQELDLILTDGETKRCSQQENRDLFRFSLSGLGQLGFISNVRFKPIAYKKFTSVFYILSTGIKDFITQLKTILDPEFIYEVDHFSSYWLNGSFIIEIGKSVTDNDSATLEQIKKKIGSHVSFYKNTVIKDYHFYLHEVRENWVNRYGVSHHIWEDYIFGIEQLESFLENVITTKKISRFQNILPALYIVACNMGKTGGIPFSPTYGSTENMVYSVGFYYMVKYGKTKELQTAQQHHRQYMLQCIELHGRPYLYGWHGLSEEQKQSIYDEDYKQLKVLKKKYDPGNLLNPGTFVAV